MILCGDRPFAGFGEWTGHSTNMREPLVLSIFFNTRGFGYALFEADVASVDWGIADVLPEFAPRVPPMRNLWKSEDYRMGLFDALSLTFTFYAKEHLNPE